MSKKIRQAVDRYHSGRSLSAGALELGQPGVISVLGQTPTYIHSNEVTMQQGTKTAFTMLEDELALYIKSIKAQLRAQIEILVAREKVLYSGLGLKSFQEFKDVVWDGFVLQQEVVPNEVNLAQAVAAIRGVNEMAWHCVLEKNDTQNPKEVAQAFNQKLDEIEKLFPLNDEAKKILHNSTRLEINSIANGEVECTTSGIARKVNNYILPFLAEHIFTRQAEKIINDKINVQLNTIHTGRERKQGSADTEFQFKTQEMTFTAGATIKMRRLPAFDANLGQTVLKDRFGSESTKSGFDQQFITNAQLVNPISSNFQAVLQYMLAHYFAFEQYGIKISNQEDFVTDVKVLLAYAYCLFGVLGENWMSVTDKLPLFYISGTDIMPVRNILQLFLNISTDKDILQYTTKDFGDWMRRSGHLTLKRGSRKTSANLSEFQHTELWDAKSKALSSLPQAQRNYQNIKSNTRLQKLLEQAENQWKSKTSFKVTYKILNDNIKAIGG